MALSGVALLLSMVTNSRLWLHSTGALHVWYHLGLFGLLAFVACYIERRPLPRMLWLLGFGLLGLCMEYAEMIRFHGDMEWNDVQTDALGVALGGLFGWLLWRRSTRR